MVTRSTMQETLAEEALEALAARSLDGDEDAWAKLWLALAPMLSDFARWQRVAARVSRCPEQRLDVGHPRHGPPAQGRAPRARAPARAPRVPGRIVPALAPAARARCGHRPG